MKLLVLGGPRFLGRAIADVALSRGHELTFFNRGHTNPELYPDAKRLRGDRAGDLHVLAGRERDAVIDTSGLAAAKSQAVNARSRVSAVTDPPRFCVRP